MCKKIIILTLFVLLALTTISVPLAYGETNLLVNGGFEAVGPDNKPESWQADFWKDTSSFSVSTKKVRSGKYSLEIKSNTENDARMVQTVMVKPNSYYRLSGWISTEEVVPFDKVGANLCVMLDNFYHSQPVNGSSNWTFVDYYFRTHAKQTEVKIGARLGMWSNEVKGTAYFDDLSLVELDTPPANYVTLAEKSPQTTTSQTPPTTTKKGRVNWFWLALLTILIIAAIIVYEMKNRMKRRQ